ncbi:metallophosphoesterase family protein [Aeoliella mucimassa]|uniref:Serine/threonine-protein phosphatase 1 n=1 Tax=Aeoliella mucimassa TaxID=2527972 RepID=A0A518AQR4_9BACT|nr:metallophosphoesterase family protein [Aeoliella mucimassa]QDU57069.1 Serine/threonine-protein phosphatase 1 [Aeoliella mucimassa]
MRTLAVGDIHGCYQALTTLESFAQFETTDRIVTLGDYIDRGPDSRLVIDWLIEYDQRGQLVPLRGNHELILFAARTSPVHFRDWLVCGGDTVLTSYGIETLDDLPEEHWQFLSTRLRAYYELPTHFFVHATAYHDRPLAEQPDYMLYWERFDAPEPHQSGRTMVCGHTAQRSGVPLDVGHAVCIDTCAYGGGWLTCLDIASGWCWQANEAGKTRSFWLADGPH